MGLSCSVKHESEGAMAEKGLRTMEPDRSSSFISLVVVQQNQPLDTSRQRNKSVRWVVGS